MTRSQTMYILAGLLIVGFGMPGVSLAVTGCSNANLIGTYNAQVSSAALTGVLNALNSTSGSTSGGSTGSTGSTGNTGGMPSGTSNGGLFGGDTGFGNMGGGTTRSTSSGASSGATTAQTVNPGGFGNNPKSFGGAIPGVGRYYFDGSGNIVGQGAGTSTQAIIGSYSVSTDCSATLSLQTGETFSAILSSDGSDILFVQANAGQGGAVGRLSRGATMCLASSVVQSFGFSFFGAQAIPSGSGSASAANIPGTFAPASGIGTITLDGQGGFALRQWAYTDAGFKQTASVGAYSIGADCSLRLTFANTTGAGGTTGSVSSPMSFRGLLVSGPSGQVNGVVVEQVDANTLGMGDLISQ